jgi:DNA-binding transcriptional ArsR family regulator
VDPGKKASSFSVNPAFDRYYSVPLEVESAPVTEQEAANVARALAHPTRIAIVRVLRDAEEPISAAIFAKKVPGHGTPSRMNYHFTEFRRLGVTDTASGPGAGGWKPSLHRLTPVLGALAAQFVSDADAARVPS